jgi:hypothetical protein
MLMSLPLLTILLLLLLPPPLLLPLLLLPLLLLPLLLLSQLLQSLLLQSLLLLLLLLLLMLLLLLSLLLLLEPHQVFRSRMQPTRSHLVLPNHPRDQISRLGGLIGTFRPSAVLPNYSPYVIIEVENRLVVLVCGLLQQLPGGGSILLSSTTGGL